MLEEKMNISKEDVDEIRFERVHRMPTRRNQDNPTKPRPLLQNLVSTKTNNSFGLQSKT